MQRTARTGSRLHARTSGRITGNSETGSPSSISSGLPSWTEWTGESKIGYLRTQHRKPLKVQWPAVYALCECVCALPAPNVIASIQLNNKVTDLDARHTIEAYA
jgi:hypothetical protein